MTRKLAFLLLAVLLATAIFSLFACTTNDLVKIEGGLISGTTMDGVRSYKGTPFAASTAGENRWKPPQPVKPWADVREARGA